VDSTFNDPKGHAEAICREIIGRKMKVRLRTMGMNPRHCSEELFELMIHAGFAQIDATPDTASVRMLKTMGKGFHLEEVINMATLIRKFNLPTMWFFLFGGPGEDRSTFNETVDFIRSYISPEDLVYLNAGLRIYPHTPLYRTAVNEGRIKPGQSILYPPVYYYSEEFPKQELEQCIRETAQLFHNCIPALETAPPKEMIGEAVAKRSKEELTEPMFRTLLGIRKQWRIGGRI
jgi:anaerobic magnesium-protoporphyrin IX monomethyl ester cyclase